MNAVCANSMLEQITCWVDAGTMRPLDLALTNFVREMGPESDPAVLLAVALVSARNGHGHVCLDLKAALANPADLLSPPGEERGTEAVNEATIARVTDNLSLPDWLDRLRHSPAVSVTPSCDTDCTANVSSHATPLVLVDHPERPLLYLRRYWHYEQDIREQITARVQQPLAVAEDDLQALLKAVFADSSAADNWQKVACALAARSRFAIITGGPGTGKTTTVIRLLAVLQGLTLNSKNPPLRIRLAAPTGKAAARLNASITALIAGLPFEALPEGEHIRAAIPTEVTTLHRLLGTIPNSRHFRHHRNNPLLADVVVVDEASMVDVEMMAQLLTALHAETRIILLGDKDQLASVEAGAVLGDLCQRAREAHYQPETAEWLARVTGIQLEAQHIDRDGNPLDQSIAMLRQSYRFRPEGGIGALAALVNDGMLHGQPVTNRTAAALALFAQIPSESDAKLGQIEAIRVSGEHDRALDAHVLTGYQRYLSLMQEQYPGDEADQAMLEHWALAVQAAYADFQVLATVRRGAWGVEQLNARIARGLVGDASGNHPHWYAGRPVLVTRNDYGLRLMNGDVGITLAVPVERDDGSITRVLRVAFPAGDGAGGVRWILPSRLQSVETAYAMTVHKSQGSEFAQTTLILPSASSPVLTRELIYTAITRSKQTFTLVYSTEAVLTSALEQRVQRLSGFAGASTSSDVT